MSDSFEYVVLGRDSFWNQAKGFDHQELENRLNDLGKDGFRIIKVISDPSGEDWMIILSKSRAYQRNYHASSAGGKYRNDRRR